jgi:hypothetical protein
MQREADNHIGALFVQDGLQGYAKRQQTALEFFVEQGSARNRGYWPESLTVYDVPNALPLSNPVRRYGSTWVENPGGFDWVIIREATSVTLPIVLDSLRAENFGAWYVAASKDAPRTYSVIMRKGIFYSWDITFGKNGMSHDVVQGRIDAGWTPKNASDGGDHGAVLWVRYNKIPAGGSR